MPITVIDISFCGNIELIVSADKEILSDPEFAYLFACNSAKNKVSTI